MPQIPCFPSLPPPLPAATFPANPTNPTSLHFEIALNLRKIPKFSARRSEEFASSATDNGHFNKAKLVRSRFSEIRPILPSPFLTTLLSPLLNLAMMARQKHLGNLHPLELRGPRVVRPLHQRRVGK